MAEINYEVLINKAFDMLKMAYVPYSHFHVGAALLCEDGTIFTGCNIENSAYGPSNCAERTAIFKAVSEGYKKFSAIVVVGGLEGNVTEYCTPCGVCRQVMREFCSRDFKIICAKSPSDYKEYTLDQLLPQSFSLSDF